ncbi:MAG: hypothetical protein WDN72_02310 [Alphaproteobacteria bacterium]
MARPDKTFASLPQPNVDSVDATLDKQAAEAMKNGDPSRAAEFYQQLISGNKGTPRRPAALQARLRRSGPSHGRERQGDRRVQRHPQGPPGQYRRPGGPRAHHHGAGQDGRRRARILRHPEDRRHALAHAQRARHPLRHQEHDPRGDGLLHRGPQAQPGQPGDPQ